MTLLSFDPESDQQLQPIEGFVGERACIICSTEGPNPITYLWMKYITKDGRSGEGE